MSALKCIILDDYQNVALSMADWSKLSPHVKVQSLQQHFTDFSKLVAAIRDADILVIMRERTSFTATLFAALPKLKLLVTSGMRNAAIDLTAAKKHGVTVCGTQSFPEPPVELTWALILGLARHLIPENHHFKNNGPWQSTVGVDLHGKTLGLIGLGKLGSRVAHIAKAFGMHVIAWSQNLTAEKAAEYGVELASSKHALLTSSDFVSIHVVLSDRTRNLLNTEDLAIMKPSAYLINTARADIVNQDALIHALKNQKIAGAGLDVFDIEPLPKDHPYRKLPNVLATPHLGYVTERNYHTYFTEALEDIEAFMAGKPIRFLS